MPAFILAIFLSAFLLFQVQPIIARYILPWYGGSPGVWTTCMLCFQVGLLGGYAYAHGLVTFLRNRRGAQIGVHIALIALSALMLPITPDAGLKPTGDESPFLGIVWLLVRTVGLPYIVVSASGPLLQHWFAEASGGKNPYRLYAVSNFGSLLGLLSYPFLFEPMLGLFQQTMSWTFAYAVYGALAIACAVVFILKTNNEAAVGDSAAAETSDNNEIKKTTILDRLLWVALPAVGSILLLATTSQMTQDVAVVPFLWVVPLGLYLVTFIISFDHARWYHRAVWIPLTMISIGGLLYLLNQDYGDVEMLLALQIAIYVVSMFCSVMICHGEVVRLKPHPSKLTGFYLAISLGGAVGGAFVSQVAPRIFDGYWELHLGLLALGFLTVICVGRELPKTSMRFWLLLVLPAAAAGSMLTVHYAPTIAEGAPAGITATGIWIGGVALIVIFTIVILGVCFPKISGKPAPLICLGVWTPMIGVMLFFLWTHVNQHGGSLAWRRGFYGVLRVYEFEDWLGETYRTLHHGRISHGHEYLTGEEKGLPTTYYAPGTGAGLLFDYHPNRLAEEREPMHYGVVGLGTGTLAAFAKEGDRVRFYEINAQVEELAREQFGYLRDCKGEETVILGDARITLERELANGENQKFDALFIDAFSGDSIPIHLMTREAFELYFEHLKPDGVLAVHITNLHLDLSDPVRVLAKEMEADAAWIDYWTEDSYGSDWVLISRNRPFIGDLHIDGWVSEWERDEPKPILWTDDYSNLFQVIYWDPEWDWLWSWVPGLGSEAEAEIEEAADEEVEGEGESKLEPST